ncbi:hypothetical protein ERJ75_001378800 [Trypanosoma vivax]|nr:hypothetical protein ERJ75_001378800 [Trypanosoma vivax]
MSRRKAEPAVPKSHGRAVQPARPGQCRGSAGEILRSALTACRDGGSERRTQQDASIFRHDGLRGHASREASCGVHSQGLAQNGGTKRATRSMATRQAQWCLAASSRVRPRTRTGGRQQWSVVIAAKSTRSRSRHLRQNVTARAPSGGEEVCRRLVRGMSLLTRRADAPQRTAAVRRGKAPHTGRGTLTTGARPGTLSHSVRAKSDRGSARGTVASGSEAVGSRPDTVMRGRGAGTEGSGPTTVDRRLGAAAARYLPVRVRRTNTRQKEARGAHGRGCGATRRPGDFPLLACRPWPSAACSTFHRAHEENVHTYCGEGGHREWIGAGGRVRALLGAKAHGAGIA